MEVFTVGVIVASLLGAVIGPEWAPAVNTALVIILALVHAKEAAKRRKLERELHHVHQDATDAKRAAGADKRRAALPPRHQNPDTGQRRRIHD
jgi:hypothetical protein